MVRVIDASVAVKWFVQEAGREKAFALLKEILEDPGRFAVPELFFFEVINVFCRLFPKPTDLQLALLEQITVLGIERFSMTPELMKETFFFQKFGLSAYDASYAALAKMTKGIWVTFDAKAHKQLISQKVSLLL